jgi:hypothetical protein
MPDADKEATINAIVGAAFGAAGQRYSAVVVCVDVFVQCAVWCNGNDARSVHRPSVHRPPDVELLQWESPVLVSCVLCRILPSLFFPF